MAKLLIVDDDQETCEFLKEFFEFRKCVVLTADSGQLALDLVKKENPDIVLLDIKMERMGGLEALKEIKAHNKDIAVIMVTGVSDTETKNLADNLGADGFIIKPLNEQVLEGTVCLRVANLSKESEETNGNG